ncbi:hypothetical protein DL239_09115 [Sedimentitalea sp. CY04]|uniref:Uncharacterized protein n=1 Tax=Parasedimentitalea denitrificans TaxID=2211118 RepID=A0ABX0W659_9RHOB|nr:hypothetical protein [Sedimentitalea sp. CY04]NIZ61135.1 hypothetical protein [Sedimentitalea sp. CY04]
MSVRKSLGIIVVCTQAVVAVDYNMQAQKAGLGPGELSMKDYSAIVRARYNKPDITASSAIAVRHGNQDRLAQISPALTGHDTAVEAKPQSSETAPEPVCVRRGNALNCN